MAVYKGDFPVNHTAVCLEFDSFAASTGASSATSSFAAGDILIYKDGSTTQRSSSAGITVSTSFDSNTGLQQITIDLSDNTDSGFYAAGHEYQVAVADVTIDAQTVRFWVGSFSIERAGGVLALLKAGTAKVDVTKWLTGTIPAVTTTGVPLVDVKYLMGTLQTTGVDIGTNLDVTVSSRTKPADTQARVALVDECTLTDTTTALTNAATNGDFTATMKTSITTAATAAQPTVTLANNAITDVSMAASSGLRPARSNTAQSGTGSTIVLDSGASSVDNFYRNSLIRITSGTGFGQARFIASYVGSTKTATVVDNWITNPDVTSTFAILMWDTTIAASVTGAVGSVTGNVGGNVSGSVGSLATQAKTDVENAVLDADVSTHHTTSGSAGAKINAAGTAADPWATALPGSYSSGTAGFILGTNLDTTVSSRGTGTALTATTLRSALGMASANMDTQFATIPTAAATAGAVWDVAISGHLVSGSTGLALNSAASAGDPWSTAIPGAYSAGTAGFIVGNRIDVAISSRLAPAGTLARVTLVDTLTTNSDKTNYAIGSGGITASSFASGAITSSAFANGAITSTILATDCITSTQLATTGVNEIADGILSRTLAAESYAADTAVPTLSQAIYRVMQNITQFSLSGTTITVKKLDKTTTAETYTLDSSTTPTSRTRAT